MKKISIMIVDDSRAARMSIRGPLQALGVSVLDAESIDDARRILTTMDRPLDLLITDQHMPGGTGLDLIRSLKALRQGQHASCKSILITCDSSTQLADDCRAAGAVAIIIKPVRPNALIEFVKKLLTNPFSRSIFDDVS
jgi:two-component system chemotaxis response regulator CheY